MNILCCYVNLNPKTEKSVKAYAPAAAFVNTSANDFEYWRVIKNHWTGERDLVIIEQDMEITAEVIPSFESCRELWCCFSYFGAVRSEFTRSLGCTRFTAELQKMIPSSAIDADVSPSWQFVDGIMAAAFDKSNIAPHVHGQVEHLHDYQERVFPGGKESPFKYDCELKPDGTYAIFKN